MDDLRIFIVQRGCWRIRVAQVDGLVRGVAELCPPHHTPLSILREPPAPADRDELDELEALAGQLSGGTGGVIGPTRALHVVLLAAAAGLVGVEGTANSKPCLR